MTTNTDTNDARIEIVDEGETTTMTAAEYVEAGGNDARASVLATQAAYVAQGTLADEVQHNDYVAQRGLDEGARVARISVPFWFKNQDDEVRETFGDNDSIMALVEDYSDKAWRIIAKRQTGLGGQGFWFTWEWTFVPKSLSSVTYVTGVETVDEAFDFGSEARAARRGQEAEDSFFDDDEDDEDEDDEADVDADPEEADADDADDVDADEDAGDDEEAALVADGGDENTEVFTFDAAEDDAGEQADIYVTDVFENAYDDTRAVLEGDTYTAKEIIKFDWETTHHEFDESRGSSGAWVVDEDSLDELAEKLAEGGYTFDAEHMAGEDEDSGAVAELEAAIDAYSTFDNITVTYEQKNGNGEAQKAGSAFNASIYDDRLQFRRHDDEHLMWVDIDPVRGTVRLMTAGSHSPYMGEVVSIEIEHPEPPEVPDDAIVPLSGGEELADEYCDRCDELQTHRVDGPDSETCLICGGW